MHARLHLHATLVLHLLHHHHILLLHHHHLLLVHLTATATWWHARTTWRHSAATALVAWWSSAWIVLWHLLSCTLPIVHWVNKALPIKIRIECYFHVVGWLVCDVSFLSQLPKPIHKLTVFDLGEVNVLSYHWVDHGLVFVGLEGEFLS